MTFGTPAADFGSVIVETDIDRLVLRQIKHWLPTYLTEAERQRNLPARLLARPKDQSYQNVLTDAEFPDAQLPGIVVTASEATGTKSFAGRHHYAANFDVAVSAVVRGRTPPETREVAAVFGGCIRWLLVQQQLDAAYESAPDGMVDHELRWEGGSIIPVPDQNDTDGRYLAAAINRFIVMVDAVITGDGPALIDPYPPPDPDNDPDTPYDPLSTVAAVVTTITPRSS
jgi:hypothetical protein